MISFTPPTTWNQFNQYAQSRISDWEVDHYNRSVIETILAYFRRDERLCQEREVDLNKGLLLFGPVGCGKTMLMRLFAPQNFRLVSTREVANKFMVEGNEILARYGSKSYKIKHLGYGPIVQYDQPVTYCFDDLGVEPTARVYGNSCNVMAEVLLDRYEQFIKNGMITHLTTNLNAEEMERLYGDRTRSRLREMCNLIGFSSEAPDRRK
jgi:hypothetical protein